MSTSTSPGQLQERPTIPCTDECLLRAGNTNCGGCGMSLGLTMLGRALAAAVDPNRRRIH